MAVGIDNKAINNSTPEDNKIKGAERFVQLILGVGLKFANQITPKIVKTLENKFPEGQCPNSSEVQEITDLRNNLVTQANKLSEGLDFLSKAALGVSTFLGTLLLVKQILQGTKTGVSLAAKFIPVIPGAIPSALSDLGDAIDKITFDKYGNSKLIKSKSISDKTLLVTSLVNKYIKNFIDQLNELDLQINKCAPNSNLIPVGKELIDIAQIELEAQQSLNESTYKGFIIEIEEVPFSTTVTRKRAVGLNQDKIKLIQTNLSFSSNEQILIEELKFIIDRDNLKAY